MRALRPSVVLLATTALVLAGCASSGPPSAGSPTAATPTATAPVDCSGVPDRAVFSVGATDPCFTAMGERFQVWLGANTHSKGSPYVPSSTFSKEDVDNVNDVQRLMGDTPVGWLEAAQWERLMAQGPPPVTELRPNGVGPLWFGMTAQQLVASGAASLTLGTADAPGSFIEVQGIQGSGCFVGEPPTGTFAAFTTVDPTVVTAEGITARSTVAELQAAYGARLVRRVEPSSPRDLTVYAVYEGDYGLAFWAPDPDNGPDSPLVLYAGRRWEIENLHPQSGWCFG